MVFGNSGLDKAFLEYLRQKANEGKKQQNQNNDQQSLETEEVVAEV